ncbi:MAG TPA: DUF6461 domain-containing protein [Acidimicrobiales bacterium]
MAEADDYLWVLDAQQSSLAVGACITVVRGSTVADVLAGFGADPSAAPVHIDPWDSTGSVHVGQVEDAVVTVEYNGFEGSRAEVLRVVSRSATAVSVFWNVNFDMRFSYASGGTVVTSFDPMFPDDVFTGTPPRQALPAIEGLPFPEHAIPSALALAERVTGVRLTRDRILRLRDAWPVTAVPPDPRPPDPYGSRGELAELMGHATPQRLQDLALAMIARVEPAVGPAHAAAMRDQLAANWDTTLEPATIALTVVNFARAFAADPDALVAEVRAFLS